VDHCTLVSEHDLVRVEPWRGSMPGPERPWLIRSSHTAYLGSFDRRERETVLLRGQAGALSHGVVFFQQARDAMEVDSFIEVGEDSIGTGRTADVRHQWIGVWGANHIRDVSGPRPSGGPPGVRTLNRLRPGDVEPADLILDPSYHPGRSSLDVGADLARQGVSMRATRRRP
jgi:serine/threonine-protein kinase